MTAWRVAAGLAILGLTAMPGSVLAAPTTTVLYNFHGKTDGGSPEGGVIAGPNGVLYGTADTGGTNDNGTIFSLTPPATAGAAWSFKVLHRLTGGAGGGYPVGLTQDKNGNLYGYAVDFGAGHGTVFSLEKPAAPATNWAFRTLYQFQGGTDGDFPSGLAIQPDGTLIGTTDHGGGGPCQDPYGDPPWGCGTVFQLNPPVKKGGAWTETVLYRFAGLPDGSTPVGAPTLVGGALYGATTEGGDPNCTQPGGNNVAGCGTVYRLERTAQGNWSETVAYSFAGGSAGSTPLGPLAVDRGGNLYGPAATGGLATPSGDGNGLIYELTPVTGGGLIETVLHAFAGGNDGFLPQAAVVVDSQGKVFGTTYLGTSAHLGSAFVLAPPTAPGGMWREWIRARFSGQQGAYPSGLLVRDRTGNLFGVTLQGGKYNQGTVYQVSP